MDSHQANTAAQRVERYWRHTFDVPSNLFARPGVLVWPHPQQFAGRHGAWLLARGPSCLISVPPDMLQQVRQRAEGMGTHDVLSDFERVLGHALTRVVGPSYQGFVEPQMFRPSSVVTTLRIGAADRAGVQQMLDACKDADRDESGLTIDTQVLYGVIEENCMVAIAGALPWAGDVCNVGVLVQREARGRGLGRAVTSALIEHTLYEEKLVVYQTLLSNHAAIALAQSLGCQEYGRMIYAGWA